MDDVTVIEIISRSSVKFVSQRLNCHSKRAECFLNPFFLFSSSASKHSFTLVVETFSCSSPQPLSLAEQKRVHSFSFEIYSNFTISFPFAYSHLSSNESLAAAFSHCLCALELILSLLMSCERANDRLLVCSFVFNRAKKYLKQSRCLLSDDGSRARGS